MLFKPFSARRWRLGCLFAFSLSVPLPALADGPPLVFGWAGYEEPSFYGEYIAKHGEQPETAVFADEEEALTKLRAGFQTDVVTFCTYSIDRWREAGVIQPIDTARLSHWKDVIPALRDAPGVTDADGKTWMVPFAWGNTSVAFRSDLAPEYVGTNDPNILFDEKYSGRLSVMAGATETIPLIAAYKGLDGFNLSDAGIETLRQILAKQRPLIRFYSEDPTQLANAMASGEVVAAIAWNSDVLALKSRGVAVEYMRPKGALLTWVCGVGLASGAPQPDKAYDVMDAMIAPSAGQWLVENWGFGHSNTQTFALVAPEKLAELGLPTSPDGIASFLADGLFARPLANQDAIVRMYEEVRAGF